MAKKAGSVEVASIKDDLKEVEEKLGIDLASDSAGEIDLEDNVPVEEDDFEVKEKPKEDIVEVAKKSYSVPQAKVEIESKTINVLIKRDLDFYVGEDRRQYEKGTKVKISKLEFDRLKLNRNNIELIV